MAAEESLGRQFAPFTRSAAGPQATYWQMAAGGGGLTRGNGVEGRELLRRSKPFPSQLKSGNMHSLMETLAPGSTSLQQRTRRLN